MKIIDCCFSQRTIEEIISSLVSLRDGCVLLISAVKLLCKISYQNTLCELGNMNYQQENEALNNKDDWISSTIQSLKKASPISLKVYLRSVSQSLLLNLANISIGEWFNVHISFIFSIPDKRRKAARCR